MVWRILLCLCIGYAFGCFSTGLLVGKRNHIDIRNYGSGNVGTTNALRTLGVKAALLTLAGDVLKCVIPVLVIKFILFKGLEYRVLLGFCTGFGVVLGHNFPFYMGFKGGKGIAVMAATILTFDLRLSLLCLLTFVAVVAVTRYVSVGSLLVALEFLFWTLYFYGILDGNWPLFFMSALFAALAFYTHRSNIRRLLAGTENKIGRKAEKV